MTETIGFIGLGQLGLPMATNLLKAGYGLRVYNRTASKADSLVAQGAYLANQPADTATSGGIVASIVWDDEALESIVTSEGFLENLGQGGIHIGMATVLPETSKKIAAIHAEHGSIYVEAPIFGRPEAAVAKQLWIPFAGTQAAKERVRPLLEAMGAQGIFDIGEEVGAAVLVKLIGNFMIGAATRSLAEGLALAEDKGVDPKAVADMLTNSLFNTPLYKSYGKMIVEKTMPTNVSPIALKDIGLFRTTAQMANAPTPIADLMRDIFQAESEKV